MKSHHCSDCGETNPEKFKGSMKGRCYACHKKLYNAYYRRDKTAEKHLCINCGETTPHNFFSNSKSKCKKCTYEPKRKLNRLKRIKQAKPPAIKLEKPPKFTCKKCGKTGKENFYNGMTLTCAECYNMQATLYYYPFYNDLIKTQGNHCAMCDKTPQELGKWRLAVDHDHQTNLVRGLLCTSCNFIAGQITQDMALNLARYLQEPPAIHLQIQFPEKMKKKKPQ
jgi:hypothetical protein